MQKFHGTRDALADSSCGGFRRPQKSQPPFFLSLVPAFWHMAGNESRLHRFDIACELMKEGRNHTLDELNAEVERRLAQRVQDLLAESRGLPDPVILRGLLSQNDIEAVSSFSSTFAELAAAPQSNREDDCSNEHSHDEDGEDHVTFEPGSAEWLAEQMRLTAALDAKHYELEDDDADDDAEEDLDDVWVQCGDGHEKVFLHAINPRATSFSQARPELFGKIQEATRRHADSAGMCALDAPLNVRCVEFHSYREGGGLLDPGHRDTGSTITLSVQLSQPGAAEDGGRFVTTNADGLSTQYELAPGDAVLFCSHMIHGVTQLCKGTRNSLVLEWWDQAANVKNRDR